MSILPLRLFLGFKHVLLKNNYCQWPGCESVIGNPEDFARCLIVYCVCLVVYLWYTVADICFWLQPYLCAHLHHLLRCCCFVFSE